MTNYLVTEDGRVSRISDDLFDMMWRALDDDKLALTDTESITSDDVRKAKKKEHNDVHNKKNKDSGYFSRYFKENDRTYVCERCGCSIRSITNKSRHYKTEKCKRLSEERKQDELGNKIIDKVLGIKA